MLSPETKLATPIVSGPVYVGGLSLFPSALRNIAHQAEMITEEFPNKVKPQCDDEHRRLRTEMVKEVLG